MIRDIIDPQGFCHRIAIYEGMVYGYHNLTHGLPAGMGGALMQHLVDCISSNLPLPEGYSYAAKT